MKRSFSVETHLSDAQAEILDRLNRIERLQDSAPKSGFLAVVICAVAIAGVLWIVFS